jgi:hypothetical protein
MVEQDPKESVVIVDVKLTRGLVLVVSIAVLIATALIYFVMTGDSAQAAPLAAPLAVPNVPSDGMRQFYVGGVASGA